jgi:hypothetical protein
MSKRKQVPTQVNSLSQPADWWAAFKAAAESKGMTLSEWMADACLARLPAETRAKLSPRKPRGNPTFPVGK